MDNSAAHRFFSADAFNRTWELIEKRSRTAEDDDTMIATCMASLWHWTQREDCTPRNLSIGYWQVSRVFALAGYLDVARRFAEKCLLVSAGDEPFYLGYAHESAARAEILAGKFERGKIHLSEARRLSELVHDNDEKSLLQADLASLESLVG